MRCPRRTEAPGYGLTPLFMLLSHSVSLSLSLCGTTPVFSLPPSVIPPSCFPALSDTCPSCALCWSHGCASSSLMFGFPTSFMCRLFPLATRVCFLPPVHVLVMLTSLSWTSPLSCSPPQRTHVTLMVLTPSKHASCCLVLLHELSSSCTSSLTLHGSLTHHHTFSPSPMLTFSIPQSCLFLLTCVLSALCAPRLLSHTSPLLSHTFLPLSHLLPSPLCSSPGWHTFLLFCIFPSCSSALYASPSHACNSLLMHFLPLASMQMLSFSHSNVPWFSLAFLCMFGLLCLCLVHSYVSWFSFSYFPFPFVVFSPFLHAFHVSQIFPALTCTQILPNANCLHSSSLSHVKSFTWVLIFPPTFLLSHAFSSFPSLIPFVSLSFTFSFVCFPVS